MGYSFSSISFCPGLRPGEDTPASLHSVDTTREATVTGYKPSARIGVELAPGVAFVGGRDLLVPLDSYRPPQAGQPPVNKVLFRHSSSASLGAWSSGCIPDKWTASNAPSNKPNKKSLKKPALKIGCWNVRTLTPGLSDDIQTINDARKTCHQRRARKASG